MGKLLCRLGLHDWKLSNGVGYTRGSSAMVILFDKDCKRCGAHKEGSMVL